MNAQQREERDARTALRALRSRVSAMHADFRAQERSLHPGASDDVWALLKALSDFADTVAGASLRVIEMEDEDDDRG